MKLTTQEQNEVKAIMRVTNSSHDAAVPPHAKTAEQHVAAGVLTYVALVAGLCGLMWVLASV